MRHAAQCVGRVLRGKTDYGLMVFVDKVRGIIVTLFSLDYICNLVLTDINSGLLAPTNEANFQSGLMRILWMLQPTFRQTWRLLVRKSF
jgi:hypothetical protein